MKIEIDLSPGQHKRINTIAAICGLCHLEADLRYKPNGYTRFDTVLSKANWRKRNGYGWVCGECADTITWGLKSDIDARRKSA